MKKICKSHRQILFFVLAGGLSAVVEIGAFKIFSVYIPKIFPHETNLWGVKFPLSNIFSTVCGFTSNYGFSIWFVFERGKHSKRREFAYFMAVSVFSTVLSLLFFQIFFNYLVYSDVYLGFFTFSREIFSKISAIVLVSILNYVVKKNFIFNG